MNNMKIKVNSEAESKEAQDLFFELGYKFLNETKLDNLIIDCLFASDNGFIFVKSFRESEYKEIILPHLRDLVALKRNSIDDATHIDKIGEPWLVSGNNEFYSWADSGWMQESENVVLNYNPKPIEKPMKEYLRKNSNDTYSYIGTVRPEHVSDFMIEIPEGADEFKANKRFYKNGDSFFNIHAMVWTRSTLKKDAYATLWQRQTHPEELPFIDDEPSLSGSDIGRRERTEKILSGFKALNDQYAEIENVRQSHRTASETSNPTIKETLNQRQSQYGSFEDVATATQDLLKILEKTGLKSLPPMHKEALHMICSKMVRIVNGDHNFIESWHDIAGYATLMENELRVTDGATNSRLTYQKVINGKLQDI